MCTVTKDNHRVSAAKYSYFERSKFNVRDILFFIFDYLNEVLLYRCKTLASIGSDGTSVNYSQYIRDIMSQKMADVINHVLLNGEIEIDESAFGCVRKYGRGHSVAPQIWIFGLVERLTNHLYLFPVMDRTEETVVKIIEKVCSKGSILYTDGYASYVNLNEYGYTHFSVNHEEDAVFKYIFI